MLTGNKNTFAIESSITKAYEDLSCLALGYFVVYINGRCYGVREPDAALLSGPFDEAQNRIARRGTYSAPFAAEPDAGKIVDAIREAVYDAEPKNSQFLGMSLADFNGSYGKANFQWSAACDEAFDDGSTLYHFEVGGRVRLIGCRFLNFPGFIRHDARTIQDIWLRADDFYDVLQSWKDDFEAEWKFAPKTDEGRAEDVRS